MSGNNTVKKQKKDAIEDFQSKFLATMKIMRDSTKDKAEFKIWNDVVQFCINYKSI